MTKIVVPVREYPKWIECYVYDKDIHGKKTFLYRDVYNKELVNIETFNKLNRLDTTIEFLEQQKEIFTMLDGDKQILNLIDAIYKKLTVSEDEW